MTEALTPRLTPWVARLMIFNGAVLLLLLTVFTAPGFHGGLAFDPTHFLTRPWTAVTYMFVHGGLLHLALNTVLLFGFGPPVERRLGSRAFIFYYLYCGVGAALFALALSGLIHVTPFVGASGAALGVLLAFVLHWPDARLTIFPAPIEISARTLMGLLVGIDVVFALLRLNDGIAHIAHIGGVLAGYLFFRVQSLASKRTTARPASVVRRPVVTPMRAQEAAPELRPASPHLERREGSTDAEVDRVLDKISQFGIDSLTWQERKFLSEVAEKKRRDTH